MKQSHIDIAKLASPRPRGGFSNIAKLHRLVSNVFQTPPKPTSTRIFDQTLAKTNPQITSEQFN
jgi:hypothetical protein